MNLQRRMRRIIYTGVPLVAAALAVALEPFVTALARGRPATLPLCVCLLLLAFLHPRIREFLMTGLCYGVAFLALRDMLQGRQRYLNPYFNMHVFDSFRPFGLLVVAALAATAGVAETLQPGSVLARRCYFCATAIYATGIGLVNWTGSGQSVLLCLTGLTAFLGCIFADRLMLSDDRRSKWAMGHDVLEQTQREQAHQLALRAKEWHENPGTREDTEYEGGITTSHGGYPRLAGDKNGPG